MKPAEGEVDSLWVLLVSNKGHETITLWEAYEDAEKALYEHCLGDWDEWCIEEYGLPEQYSTGDLIDKFFDGHEDYYSLELTSINRRGKQ